MPHNTTLVEDVYNIVPKDRRESKRPLELVKILRNKDPKYGSLMEYDVRVVLRELVKKNLVRTDVDKRHYWLQEDQPRDLDLAALQEEYEHTLRTRR